MAKYAQPKKAPATAKISREYDDAEFKEVENERRLNSVSDARSIYNRLQTDNLLRSRTFALVRGQLEGNRPFDPVQQEEQGMAGNCNVNFRDSEAARDRTLLPYWKMVNDVPHRIAVTIESNSQHTGTWQAAFAECFDDFLDDWGADYFIQYMNMAENFVNFGPGIPHFADKDSARWKSVNVQRILWPKNARMSPEEWDVFAFVQDQSPADLYGKIRTKSARKNNSYLGWNVNAVKATICTFKDGSMQDDPYDYTRWQDRLVNNDIAVSTPFEPIQLIWLYVKQFDGKWGCYVFTRSGVEDFLFESYEYADKAAEIISPIWYNTGTDSMVHSIKGFAVKNFYFSSLLNKTKSRIIDSATMGMAMNFQRADGNMPDEAPPIESYGGVNIFPPGMTQITTYAQYQQGIPIVAMLENNANNNNSIYREQQQQIEETDTATQAKILAAMASETSSASASIYLSQVASLFSEQMRRLRRKGNTDKDAKEFVRRMRERNIPEEVIHKTPIRVKTGAHAGLANPAMRAMKFEKGLALRAMPGVNSRWFLENYIASEFGANAVSKALLPPGEDSDPAQVNEATVENMMFGQGQPMKVIPEDNHYVHLQTHLEPLKAIAGMAQAQQPLAPEQIAALTIAVEHSSEHMMYLSKDETMKEQFMQIRPLFSQIQSVARGILTKVAMGQRNGQQNGQNGTRQPAMTG